MLGRTSPEDEGGEADNMSRETRREWSNNER